MYRSILEIESQVDRDGDKYVDRYKLCPVTDTDEFRKSGSSSQVGLLILCPFVGENQHI